MKPPRFFRSLKKVIQSFDGKCLNCRLEKALREATDKYICVSKSCRSLVIEYYPDRPGTHSQTIARISLDKLPEGKRIPSELIIESLHEKRIELLKSASNLEKDMENIDMYEQQFEYYKKQIDKLRESMNTETRYLYHLSYYVQNS